MKIQCDVCNRAEASVFCSADEAALCDACDHRVHHANTLAGKHRRLSLLHPSPKDVPLCDICQERKAFLFCQEDRAILCRDCDVSIHKASELTRNHNRFLLTGVKLSPISALYSSSPVVPNLKTQKPVSVSPAIPNSHSLSKTSTTTASKVAARGVDNRKSQTQKNHLITQGKNRSTSSISEYLIEMLPGWQVEEFLDSPAIHDGFNKNIESEMLPFWDADLENNISPFWVPQSPGPGPLQFSQSPFSPEMAYGCPIGLKESLDITNIKSSRKWSDDNCLTVPQISPPANASKRSRTSWH